MLSPEQLQRRRSGIGSSEIAAICGLDPYRGPMDVFLAKTLPPPEQEVSAAVGRQPIKWGERIEWLIIEEWASMRGYQQIDRPGTVAFGPIALATPDAISVAPARLCEAKAVGLRMADAWSDGAIPDHYALQVQWLLGVTGVQDADLCALIGGQDFQLRELHADKELFANLMQIAEEFWNKHILTNTPPPIDHTPASKRWLKERFPRETENLRPATGEALEILSMIRENKKVLEAAKEQDEALRNNLRAMVGDAQGIDGVATWKWRKGYSFTTNVEPGRVLRLAKE